MSKTFKAMPLAFLVLAVAAPAFAQDEYPGYKPDPNGPDAGSYSSSKGGGLGEWQDKNYSWAIKLGCQLDFMPGQYKTNVMDPGFALALANEYHFYKPLWLQVATNIGVNGNYLDWGLQVGLLVKILPGRFTPTLRGAIAFAWRQFFEDRSDRYTSNFMLGGSFGPGIRFLFGEEMDKAFFIDLDFYVGKFLRSSSWAGYDGGGNRINEQKELVFIFTPMVGFEF